MCNWYRKKVEKFRKRATPGLFLAYTTAKVLGGIGIGVLLTTYWPTTRWNPVGWGLLAIAIIMGVYVKIRVCK